MTTFGRFDQMPPDGAWSPMPEQQHQRGGGAEGTGDPGPGGNGGEGGGRAMGGGGRGGRRSGRTGATAQDTTRGAEGGSAQAARAAPAAAPRARSRQRGGLAGWLGGLMGAPTTPSDIDVSGMHYGWATEDEARKGALAEVEHSRARGAQQARAAGALLGALGGPLGSIMGKVAQAVSGWEHDRMGKRAETDPFGVLGELHAPREAPATEPGEGPAMPRKRPVDSKPKRPTGPVLPTVPGTTATPAAPATPTGLATPGTEIPSFIAAARSDIQRARQRIGRI